MDTSPDKKALPASLTNDQDVEDRDDQNRDQPATLLDEAGKTTRSPLEQNQSGRKTLHQLGFSEEQIKTIKESQDMYEAQHAGEAEIRSLREIGSLNHHLRQIIQSFPSLNSELRSRLEAEGLVMASRLKHCLVRLIIARGLYGELAEDITSWEGMVVEQEAVATPLLGAEPVDEWRVTTASATPRADVARPRPNRGSHRDPRRLKFWKR